MKLKFAGCIAISAFAFMTTQATAFESDRQGLNGKFSFVTYNVAGLPSIIGSSGQDPNVTTPEMGRRLLRWDVVNVQEDFNYHAQLYSTTKSFSYRTATSGGVPFGSGLNTMSYMPVSGLERIKWRRCRAEDCLTPKGFTFQRLMVGQGSYVDMYNLHAQAGSTADDLSIRRDNFTQLAEFINWRSVGNAVVVAGDTNMRYTRVGEPIREFLASTGLVDPFVQSQRGGVAPAAGSPENVCVKGQETNGCEVVDKIFYRSGRDLNLSLDGYSNEDRNFIASNGKPLSDHRPIAAWFGWTQLLPKFELVANASGKCVDVAGRSQKAGSSFIQYDCLSDAQRGSQLFRQMEDTLRVTHTGMCLEVQGASMQQGGKVVQWPCNGLPNQRVRFSGNQIIFQHSGMCLNVSGAAISNDAELVQWPCVSAPNERFTKRFPN